MLLITYVLQVCEFRFTGFTRMYLRMFSSITQEPCFEKSKVLNDFIMISVNQGTGTSVPEKVEREDT